MLANLTKTEAVYRETRWQILTGALPPATTVNQSELAEKFSVSPTPVREALRRLESEGLIVFVEHAKVMVSGLDVTELDELYAVRGRLDTFAGELAAKHRTEQDLAKLRDLLNRGADESLTERFERNREIHRLVYTASGNRQLTSLLDQLWDRTERYRIILVANETSGAAAYMSSHSDDDHKAIVDALAHGDAKRVGSLLRTHIKHSHDHIRAMLQKPG